MMGEAFAGFGAFNTKKNTGVDTIDFIKNRQLIAEGVLNNEAYFGEILGKPRRSRKPKYLRGIFPPIFFERRRCIMALNNSI